MPDLALAAAVIYVQAGIFALGYLVYRRLAEIRGQIALERGRAEVAIRGLNAVLGNVEERVKFLERLSRRALTGTSLQPREHDWRSRALEMTARGASPAEIASALRLPRPEAELLVKLQGLMRGQPAQEAVRIH